MEVVGDLSEDASPVDGVYGCEAEGRVDLFVGEESLDDILVILCQYTEMHERDWL